MREKIEDTPVLGPGPIPDVDGDVVQEPAGTGEQNERLRPVPGGQLLIAHSDEITGARPADRRLAPPDKTLGPDSPETAYAVEGIADALRALGDTKSALPMYQRALAIREKALGPTHVEVAETLTGLGEVKLATGDAKQATALLERALAIRTTQPGDPAELAETRTALAKARAKR